MVRASLEVRVGTDVESVAAVVESLERFGERFARRLFTAHEIEACGGISGAAAARLTARFAAKEAVLKLLSPTDVVPNWRSIEIWSAPNGAPKVRLLGNAAELARERGLYGLSISMSHGAGIGTATVVALAAPGGEASDG